MEMQGLKPSVLMGKFKQHLPPGVLPDNDLFLSMFLIRLPPSMREAIGGGTHETAAAMVKAADALQDAWGGHNPTVAAALTQQSRSPAPSRAKRGDKRSCNADSKSRPPSHPDFYFLFKTLAMACVNLTIIMPIKLTGVLRPVLGRKTSMPPSHFWFGGQFNICHCHIYVFPRKCWIEFSPRRIDK
jgi:hypothetical protein